MLGHKTCLKKFQNIEMVKIVLCGHIGNNLEINKKNIARNCQILGIK